MKLAVTFLMLFVLIGISMADYQIIATIDAPDTNISGLGYGNGSLWAVDQVTEFAYQVDPASGAVQNVWFCAENTTRKPSGLTFANNTVYIAAGATSALTDPWCYKYNASGTYLSCFDLDC